MRKNAWNLLMLLYFCQYTYACTQETPKYIIFFFRLFIDNFLSSFIFYL